MHYIRLLRTPALVTEKGRPSIPVVLTITTDLGDSFLTPRAPIKLKVGVYESDADRGGRKVPGEETLASSILTWAPGTRVLKTELALPPRTDAAVPLRVFAFPTAQLWGGSTSDVVTSLSASGQGRIMPVWADVQRPGQDPSRVSCRRLRIGKEDEGVSYLEIEEDIGESIARHVWDAGVVTTSFVLGQTAPDASLPSSSILSALSSTGLTNVLELGCGVGILGLGVATWLAAQPGPAPSVLLTDLPEATERASANIARWNASATGAKAQQPPHFESLDWDDGRNGVFGPLVKSRPWDLVVLSDCTYNVDVLPALVGTLSALHDSNKAVRAEAAFRTRVLLATKPRHESEKALSRLMEAEGWSTERREVFPLPVVGGDVQSIELFLFIK